jgi:uncharacterized membrane protein
MDPQNNQNQAPQNVPNNNTIMGVLSYLGPLVIIPYLVGRNNSFVKFHIKQGLVVFGLEVIVWLLGFMVGPLWILLSIVNLATLILSIIGIINVVQGKEKVLPLVGGFAQNFKI